MVNYSTFFYIFLFFFNISAVLYADVHIIYKDDKLICKAELPEGWKKISKKTKNNYAISLSDRKGAEIFVTAYGVDINSEEYENLQNQYLKKTEAFTKITKTGNITAVDGAKYKILLFEFAAHRKRFLQRTVLIEQKGLFLIVECRAPVKNFSRYTELFDNVMASIDFSYKAKIIKSEDIEEKLQDEKNVTDNLQEVDSDWEVFEKSPALSGLSDEAKKAMKIEFKKIKELEEKGIIERIE